MCPASCTAFGSQTSDDGDKLIVALSMLSLTMSMTCCRASYFFLNCPEPSVHGWSVHQLPGNVIFFSPRTGPNKQSETHDVLAIAYQHNTNTLNTPNNNGMRAPAKTLVKLHLKPFFLTKLTTLRSSTPSLASCNRVTNLLVSKPRLFSCLLEVATISELAMLWPLFRS